MKRAKSVLSTDLASFMGEIKNLISSSNEEVKTLIRKTEQRVAKLEKSASETSADAGLLQQVILDEAGVSQQVVLDEDIEVDLQHHVFILLKPYSTMENNHVFSIISRKLNMNYFQAIKYTLGKYLCLYLILLILDK